MTEGAYGLGFFGRPPFAPFSRAAAILAVLVDCPPFRPSRTAAGFLRGTAYAQRRFAQLFAGFVGRHADIEHLLAVHRAGIEPVRFQHRVTNAAEQVGQSFSLLQREEYGAVGVGLNSGGQFHNPQYNPTAWVCQVGGNGQKMAGFGGLDD